MVKNIQKNLTNIVIIIGLVSSIGVGFSKFGKLELTIEQLSTATAPDLSGIENNGFSVVFVFANVRLCDDIFNLYQFQENQNIEY